MTYTYLTLTTTLFKTYEEIILWTDRGENLINGKKV